MEYGLEERRHYSECRCGYYVLILVLMEYGLEVMEQMFEKVLATMEYGLEVPPSNVKYD